MVPIALSLGMVAPLGIMLDTQRKMYRHMPENSLFSYLTSFGLQERHSFPPIPLQQQDFKLCEKIETNKKVLTVERVSFSHPEVMYAIKPGKNFFVFKSS